MVSNDLFIFYVLKCLIISDHNRDSFKCCYQKKNKKMFGCLLKNTYLCTRKFKE